MLDVLKDSLGKDMQGKRVLELGSGTGLLGLAVAAYGGHVLITDLESIVVAMLNPNVLQNKTTAESVSEQARDTRQFSHSKLMTFKLRHGLERFQLEFTEELPQRHN